MEVAAGEDKGGGDRGRQGRLPDAGLRQRLRQRARGGGGAEGAVRRRDCHQGRALHPGEEEKSVFSAKTLVGQSHTGRRKSRAIVPSAESL